MDWTVKDHECWKRLFQGLHVDYTGSYAFFISSIDVGLRPILSQCVGIYEIEPVVDSERICS